MAGAEPKYIRAVAEHVLARPRLALRDLGTMPCPTCGQSFGWCYLGAEIRGGCFNRGCEHAFPQIIVLKETTDARRAPRIGAVIGNKPLPG